MVNIFTIANIVLDSVYNQLGGTEDGVPCSKFVSLQEPHNPCGDYVAVWIDQASGNEWSDECNTDNVTEILFNVKLVRNCGFTDECNAAVADQVKVAKLLNDFVWFRSGILSSVGLVESYLNQEHQHSVEFLMSSTNFSSDDSEQFSVIYGGITFKVKLCVPEFTDPIVVPAHCDCVPVAVSVDSVDVSDSYGN